MVNNVKMEENEHIKNITYFYEKINKSTTILSTSKMELFGCVVAVLLGHRNAWYNINNSFNISQKNESIKKILFELYEIAPPA